MTFFNSQVLNTKYPKILDIIKKFEKDCLDIEKTVRLLLPLSDNLPTYFVEYENLKEVSFSANTNTERERNNKILRSFLKLHDSIEFEIRTYSDKNDSIYEAIMTILKDKKKTLDDLIDIFLKK